MSATPETDAFMTLIDDSEIDLGMVEAKLGDMERERDQYRSMRDTARQHAVDAEAHVTRLISDLKRAEKDRDDNHLAWCKAKESIEAIREACSHYADGSPDAAPRDWFANMVLGIIERDGK